MKKFMPVSIALALAAPLGALAQTPKRLSPEIQTLRHEIEAMRTAYEARLQALEQRLRAAEQVTVAIPPPQNTTAAAPGPAASASAALPAASATALAAPQAATAASAASAASGGSGANAFNPAISLILSGGYTRTTQDPAAYRITGFQLPQGAEAGPGTRGLSLAESELTLSANIDPWLRGALSIALQPDNSVSLEEAFVQTTSLGHGLSVKAGRFLSGVGYLNPQHAHTWDFVDNPLAYQALLGTQFGDDGVQLKWLAPMDQYLELGAELGRGRSFPGSDTARNGAGMSALTAHTGGDIGDSHNWRAGLSMLNAKAADQGLSTLDATGNLLGSVFTGSTRVWVADGVWKWAPNGNATQTSFKLQGEYLRSTRHGSLGVDVGGASVMDAYRAVQSGWYVQGVYQFMPKWRVGLRTERLNAGTPDYGINAASFAASAYKPSKNTLMLDFNPSEFSQFRLQLAQDRSRQGVTDNQLFLQYQMSLGAHGAHGY